MSEWITFKGRVVLPKKERFSVEKHLKQLLKPFGGEFFYHEKVEDSAAIRVHAFRLSVITSSDTLSQVANALRSIPGTVDNLWVEGWLHL